MSRTSLISPGLSLLPPVLPEVQIKKKFAFTSKMYFFNASTSYFSIIP